MSNSSKADREWHEVIIIAPISSDPDFEDKMALVEALCREWNLSVRIPRVGPEKFLIAAEIAALQQAKIVIADISFERPSCYYEIGLAEALQVPVCLVALQGTTIHQNAQFAPVQFYEKLEDYTAILTSIFEAMQGHRIG